MGRLLLHCIGTMILQLRTCAQCHIHLHLLANYLPWLTVCPHVQVLVMIDGQRIKNFEFKNCVLKTL